MSPVRRALVVAPEPFFAFRGTPFSVYYRTLVMAEQGVVIDLLTYGQGRDVAIPGVRQMRIPKVFRKVRIGPSVVKLFLDGLLVARFVGLVTRRRYDFVHAHEEAVFFAAALKPLFGYRLVYDMHSSLPQQLSNFEFTRSRTLVGLFERLERMGVRRSDAVITICPDLADYAGELIRDGTAHFLIENSILDPVLLADDGGEEPAETSDEWALEAIAPAGHTVILYAGSFEPYQGLETLVAAFARVAPDRPDTLLALVGGAPEQVQRLSDLCAEHGVAERCRLPGTVPRELVRALLQRTDLLVSPRSAGTNTPLKIYEQIASGVPLLATSIHAHTQVLDETVCFLAEPSVEGLAAGLRRALADPVERAERASRALELYDRRYSREAYETKIRALLDHVAPCAAS